MLEIRGLHSFPSENPIPNYINAPNFIPTLHYLNPTLNPNPHDQQFTTTPQYSSSLSTNSTTSDDQTEELYYQQSIIDERKQRRMISNRESARRSRMRKQKHLDELWSQVVRLRSENHNLLDKLNRVSESHELVVKENERLKEEASDLRELLNGLQVGSTAGYTTYNDPVDNFLH